MFILQNTPAPTTQADSITFAQQDIDAGSSKLDLTLNLEETVNGCAGWVEYSTDLFDLSTIERLIDQYQFLLKAIVENPGRALSELASERADESISQIEVNGSEPGSSERRSSIEQKLVSIWSEVLGVQQITPTDNLFDLGGHSLLITRIISRIRSIFKVDVPIHAFFEAPSVTAIAEVVESELESGRIKNVAVNQVIRKRGSLQPV
jgi:acyl carrier protein